MKIRARKGDRRQSQNRGQDRQHPRLAGAHIVLVHSVLPEPRGRPPKGTTDGRLASTDQKPMSTPIRAIIAYLDTDHSSGVGWGLLAAAIGAVILFALAWRSHRNWDDRPPVVERVHQPGPLTFWKVVAAIVLGGWILYALISASQP